MLTFRPAFPYLCLSIMCTISPHDFGLVFFCVCIRDITLSLRSLRTWSASMSTVLTENLRPHSLKHASRLLGRTVAHVRKRGAGGASNGMKKPTGYAATGGRCYRETYVSYDIVSFAILSKLSLNYFTLPLTLSGRYWICVAKHYLAREGRAAYLGPSRSMTMTEYSPSRPW